MFLKEYRQRPVAVIHLIDQQVELQSHQNHK